MARKSWDDDQVKEFFTRPAETDKLEVICEIDESPGLMKYARQTLKTRQNKTDLNRLLDRFRTGIDNPGIGTRSIETAYLFELRAREGARCYFYKEDDIIKVVGISDKNNQDAVLAILKLLYIN